MSKPASQKRKTPRGSPDATHVQYVFRLFMAGKGANSQMALANLRHICRMHLNGRCTIKTIDVVKDFQAAVRENILITPALVVDSPLPRVVVLGNLSDRSKLLAALQLSEGAA